MELSLENIVRAAFPRTSSAVSAKFPRQALAGIMDAASLPGRAYASIADKGSYLDALGRTSAAPGNGRADTISEEILRDPTSILGIGAGGLAKAAGKKLATTAVGKVAPWLIPYAADAVANAGTSAASQYGATGAINPAQLAIGTGFGLGTQGLGAGVSRVAPKVMQNPNFRKWFSGSKVVDEAGNPLVTYHGTNADFQEFNPDFQGASTQGGTGTKYGFFHADEPGYADYWAENAAANGGGEPRVMENYLSLKNPHYINDLEANDGGLTLESELENAFNNGHDGAIVKMGNDWKTPGSTAYVTFDPTQIKSATGNRGTFDPNDPNITHLDGGNLPSIQIPGLTKRLASRYMNDTAATSGRR